MEYWLKKQFNNIFTYNFVGKHSDEGVSVKSFTSFDIFAKSMLFLIVPVL